jgi:hypothetical protein
LLESKLLHGSQLGIKGMGEGGAIGSPAAIANAIADAPAPFGVRVNEIPLTPERVLALIERAEHDESRRLNFLRKRLVSRIAQWGGTTAVFTWVHPFSFLFAPSVAATAAESKSEAGGLRLRSA